MNLPSTPSTDETVALPPAMPVAPATAPVPAAAPAKLAPQAADSLSLSAGPKVDPETLRKATEKAEADYKRLREIMQRTMISGTYPPLDTIERLARMIAASPSSSANLNAP